MKTCPACQKETASDTECTHCGVIFAKWHSHHSGEAKAPAVARPAGLQAPTRRGSRLPMALAVLSAVAIGSWLVPKGSPKGRVKAAYQGFREAVAAGDLGRTRGYVTARYAEEFQESGAGAKLQIVKALVPTAVEITEVRVAGVEASVKARGFRDGATVTGTTTLVKEGGVWKVSHESWELEPSARSESSPGASAPSLDPSFPSRARAELEEVATLPGNPKGLAAGSGGELVIGNRVTPWGFIRTNSKGKGAEKIPVFDYSGQNRAGFESVTWNGKEYVSVTNPGWYAPAASHLLNVHDPRTLKPVRHVVAPEHVGCLTWDGSGYWAGTRQNTETSGEGAFLYQLDEQLKVVRTLDSPAKGCQGLAWIASHLWLADVFSDSIYVINVDGERSETVRTYTTPLSYLSGMAVAGDDLLLVEYRDNKLWRMKRSSLGLSGASPAMGGGAPSPVERPGGTDSQAPSGADSGYRSPMDREYAETYGSKSVPELLAGLKSESFHKERLLDDLVRRGAKQDAVGVLNEMLRDKEASSASGHVKSLLRKAGAPVTFDWTRSSFATQESDFSLVEWEIEMAGDTVVTTGKLYLGREVVEGFSRPQKNEFRVPTLAQYRFRVEGPGLATPVEKTMDAAASAGEQPWNGLTLASGLDRGEYHVSLFLHAQTVKADGTPLSINNSTGRLTVERD